MKTLEIWAGFYGGLLVLALVVALPITVALYLIDQHVIPLNLAAQAVSRADIDPSQWKSNLTQGPGNVSQSHAHWAFAKGGSMAGAKDVQRVLFVVFPVVLIFCAVGLLVLSRFSGGFLDAAIADVRKKTNRVYVDDVRERYHHANQRRIRHRRQGD